MNYQRFVMSKINRANAPKNIPSTGIKASNMSPINRFVSFFVMGGICSPLSSFLTFGENESYHGIPSTFIFAITLPSSSSYFFFSLLLFIFYINGFSVLFSFASLIFFFNFLSAFSARLGSFSISSFNFNASSSNKWQTT